MANGKIVRVEIVDGGEGYSSVPTVSVAGFPNARFGVELAFDKRFERNGAVRSVSLAPVAR